MNSMQNRCLLLLACLLAGQALAETRAQFVFDGWDGPPLDVYLTVPAALAPDWPVIFVMHGQQRNANEYRDQWHELAIRHDFVLVVPELNRRDFPGSEAYNLGGVYDEKGRRRPPARWSFCVIEPLFDAIRERHGLVTEHYSIYGHSAAGQFVHRFVMHALGLELTILLGDADDAESLSLRQSSEAAAQGPHRLVPGAIERYLREQPDIRFEVETLHYHQVVRALNQSRIDMGVVFHPSPMVDIVTEPLARARFVAVAHVSHGFGDRRQARLENLEGLPFIGLGVRGPLGQLLHEHVEDFDERFKPVIIVETYQMAMALVREGAGVAVIDEVTARSVGTDGVSVMQLEPPVHFDVALLRAGSPPLAKPAEQFVAYLRDRVTEFLEGDLHAGA